MLAGLGVARYKYVVQVVIGEERGGGVKIGARSYWDTDTDVTASDTFVAVSVLCNCYYYCFII